MKEAGTIVVLSMLSVFFYLPEDLFGFIFLEDMRIL